MNAEQALLRLLLAAAEPLPVATLARELQVEPGRVAEHLETLRRHGGEFAEHPQQGVRLIRSGLGSWVDYLEARHPDRRVIVYGRTGSTQDVARQVAAGLGPGARGVVVLSDCQTRGRGRLGRSWVAPAGQAVLMSLTVAVGEAEGGAAIDRLTFTASVAVARAAESFLLRPVTIKWPNDVHLDGRKLAGILVEIAGSRRGGVQAIIGIGFNSHVQSGDAPPELAGQLTSLAEQGVVVDRLAVADALMTEFDAALASPAEALLEAWRSRCAMLHQSVSLRSGGRDVSGEVIGLDPLDGLIVRTTDGRIVHLHAATTTTR